jgi:hypothetical protein
MEMPQVYNMLAIHTGTFGELQLGLLFTLHQYVYQFYGFIPGFMNFIHFFFDDVE